MKDIISNPNNASWLIDEIKQDEVNEFINKEDTALLVVYSEKCPACKNFMPLINSIYNNKHVPIKKIDAFKNVEFAKQIELEQIPTIAIFKKGNLIGQGTSHNPIAINALIDHVRSLP